MKCLIVAAGQGGRLREKSELKPLVSLRGVPLIERVIAGARRAGADEFLVVSGYRGEVLRAALDAFAAREGVTIRHVVNDEWQRANGVSLLKAGPYLDAPFLLTMCDHLADPAILRDLIALPVEPGRVVLAVDFAIRNPLIDLDDVTRVRCEAGRIVRIGKLLPDYDAFDTGLFLCTPAIFEALAESQRGGDDSISGAMNVLARQGRALVHDIGDRVWIDVDDPADFAKAERLLDAGRLEGGSPDPGHPEVGHPDARHSEVGHSEVGHSEVGRPNMGHPDAGHPDGNHADPRHADARPIDAGRPPDP